MLKNKKLSKILLNTGITTTAFLLLNKPVLATELRVLSPKFYDKNTVLTGILFSLACKKIIEFIELIEETKTLS